MVVSETTGKDSSRRGSSASPIRERLRRKPRQDWLVTVGQGRSPARTLRRESKGRATSRSPGRSKKFDSARLSFGGLEQVCLCAVDDGIRGMPCWFSCLLLFARSIVGGL